MVRTEEGSILYLYTKFEADSSIRSKDMGSQNFKIGSRDPGHAHLIAVVLWPIRRRDRSVLHVRTKYEADSFICSKVMFFMWDPKFGNLVT